jgi:drug/metabolite transporter (DMT)-like permease
MSLRMLEASAAGIASTLEPVVAIGAAWLLLGESLTPLQMGGAAAILVAVLLLQLTPKTFGRIVPGEHP